MSAGKLRVGIAGYGVVGKRRREVIDAHPTMMTVAVSDRVFPTDCTMIDGTRAYTDYHHLLEAENLDALFVCLSNDVAADATVRGLAKGLHIFCEKPPGRDVADIARVVAAEKGHPGLKVKYGFNHRYHDSVRDALALVRGGRLGRVINLNGTYGKSQMVSWGQTTWRTQRALAGGGILLDQGIHMVDLMRLFAGEFEQVHAFVANDFWHRDVEDNAYALMRTGGGVVAMLHSSATMWRHRFTLDITLEKGAIVLSGILSGSKSYGAETLTVVTRSDHDNGDPREQMTRYNRDLSWAEEVADFADAVVTDRAVVEGSSLEALRTMELVYQIYCADTQWRERWGLTHQVTDCGGAA